MEYGNKFKRSLFGGFRRKDVLACFDEMSEKYATELAEVREQLAESNRRQESLESEKQAILHEAAALREQTERDAAELASLRSGREEDGQKIAGLTDSHSQRVREIAELKEENRRLTFRAESLEYKSRKFDEFSNDMAGMLLAAKHNGDEMVAQAKQKAEEIVSLARKDAVRVVDDSNRSVETLGSRLTDFASELSEIRESLAQMARRVDSHLEEIEREVEHSRAGISGSTVAYHGGTPLSERLEQLLHDQPEPQATGQSEWTGQPESMGELGSEPDDQPNQAAPTQPSAGTGESSVPPAGQPRDFFR